MSTTKENEFKPLLKSLQSGDESEVLNAIKTLRSKGSASTVEAIIALLGDQPSQAILDEVSSYLFDLQDDVGLQPIIDAIGNEQFTQHKSLLISALWQSAVDASDHLLFLVELLERASYQETLEVITVIENLKGPFMEEEAIESVSRLDEIIYEEQDEQKRNLLISLNEVLNQL